MYAGVTYAGATLGGGTYAGVPYAAGSDLAATSARATRRRGASGYVTPPVPAAVLSERRGQRFDVAVALPTPVMDGHRPAGAAYTTVRGVSKPAGWDRVLVGGVDITTVNGLTTPVPSYRLMEPGGYGSSTLVIPGINPLEMAYGPGTAYRWAREGAEVVYQRTDENGTVIATDYRGEIRDFTLSGSQLVATVGGAAWGPAELIEWPPPVFRRKADIQDWVHAFLRQAGVPFRKTDAGTGIPLVKNGGMNGLAYLQNLLSMAQRRNGDQWTLMPVTPGGRRFELRLKDRTTVDCTIYLDGKRAVPDLVDEPPINSWYGSTITPDGYLERGARVPGGMQGTPPSYPMANGASFGIGTTNAQTTTGAGITVLARALDIFGYLDKELAYSTVYDADIAEAVEDLQEATGLPETGVMDKATWNRLFNLAATGPTVDGARIFPILEDKRLRKYLYDSNGHLVGINPNLNPSLQRRDRVVDFGPGWTYRRMKRWFRAQNARARETENFTGTITLNRIGVIRGLHNPGDPAPTAADVLSFRDVQAGWNAWFPQLGAAGALLHISGVDVDPGAGSAALTVDAQARDLLEIRQIRDRNQESKSDPRRLARDERRRSRLQHDASAPWERWSGMLPWDIEAPGGQWTVFWVFAGQGGRVGKFVLDTDPAAETCGAVFSRKITAAMLENRVPNPRTLNAEKESVWETDPRLTKWFDDRDALLIWGNDDNPGGYGLRRKTNDAGKATGAPLTGRVVDFDGFEYLTRIGSPVLWVGVNPDRDTVIQAGRMMWRQAEDLA